MASVSLENVSKTFDGGVTAVKNASLAVRDGELMVIVGPSGSGKTTTLRMIAGLEEATSGTIRIGERIVNDLSPKDRDIAMVFQNYALYPHMTVFGNMAFALKLQKAPRDEINKRVQYAAALLGIEDLLKRKPKSLSGGQRQRVAVGKAIVRNPQVFLFDEPLSNLDARLRATTRAELKTLHQKLQTTSVYVTHDQTEAMTLGDRICVINNGSIQQIDEPMKVYERPANRFVAGFLGSPPMNFLDGTLVTADGYIAFALGQERITLPDTMMDTLRPHVDRPVVLGIRPEHLLTEPSSGTGVNVISATVELIEPLGDRANLHLACSSGQKVVANVSSYIRSKPNDPLTLCVDTAHVHIFKPGESGDNITLSA